MKKTLLLGALLVLAASARATLFSYNYDIADTAILDGNPAGIANSQVVPSVAGGDITDVIVNVNVRLTITGGYNGDLYGYLMLQNGNGTTTSILLNRVGRTGASDYGYSASGFNIALSGDTTQGYSDIHGVSAPNNSQPYLADGRAVDPNGDFSSTTRTAGLDVLNGQVANGTWTLFLADLAGGDQSTLVSWGLDITVVPEPVTWALLIFAALGGAFWFGFWLKHGRFSGN